MTVKIICANARDALAAMPEGSVHACITSPPYWGLRDYGLEPVVWGDADCEHEWGEQIQGRSQSGSLDGSTLDGAPPGHERRPEWSSAFCRRCSAWRGSLGLEPTPELYVEHIVQVMREVRRVLRDDGTLWCNLGDAYASGTGRGYPRDYMDGGAVTAPQMMNSTPRFNIKECGLKPKDLVGIPWRVAFALQADGWWLRSDIIWSKPNPMPESVTDRPTRSHEYLFLLSKSARYFYDADAIREPLTESSIARISQPTFDQQNGGPKDYAKTGVNRHRSARKALEGLAASHKGSHFDRGKTAQHQLGRASANERHDNPAGRNKRSVWEIATQPYPGAHFAVFPEKLVEPCILAGCPERGTVLDPFAGSGTVGLVAERLGRHSVLIDASEDYCRMARERTAQMGLMV